MGKNYEKYFKSANQNIREMDGWMDIERQK